MQDPWRKRKQRKRGSPARRRFLVEQPQARPTVFTKHESRDTNHGFYVFLFTIVHYCSPLFAIVRQKILSGTSVPAPSTLATRPVRFSRITKHESRNTAFMLFTKHESRHFWPPGRCFPARWGAAWGGYGAAWAAAVHTGNAACKVFTKHETRVTKHGLYAFHETRITDFTAARSLLSCALGRGMGRLWRGMGGRRPHWQRGL